MRLPEQTVDDILKRLRRVEGQIRGIQQMLVDGRECRDVVTQISAASKALDQAGFKLVASGLTYCLNSPEKAAEEGYDLEDVQRMFLKLA
jgi:DNA-binding FrmR family transcriptional regulator